ncbi:unnamed protein product [Prorocentrum cordatum]|uniref:Uncharacterized protein n=1 Tax=Prorocentrum cordatum TaxID=2364126 RepID=A0ABN9UH22_9DINO|nr:unnamed protein product [Polarella glacialis]
MEAEVFMALAPSAGRLDEAALKRVNAALRGPAGHWKKFVLTLASEGRTPSLEDAPRFVRFLGHELRGWDDMRGQRVRQARSRPTSIRRTKAPIRLASRRSFPLKLFWLAFERHNVYCSERQGLCVRGVGLLWRDDPPPGTSAVGQRS